MILANSRGSHTMKLNPVEPQDIIGSRVGSSTRSKVLDRNGGTGFICRISNGVGNSELSGFIVKKKWFRVGVV